MDIEKISEAVKKVVKEMGIAEENGTKATQNVTLSAAKLLAEEVIKEATRRNMKIVVAVANAGGNPVLVECMDDSFIASYKIAVDKAYTSVALKMPTKDLAKLANPNGGSLYGIQNVSDRIVIFGGGEPLEVNGQIVGAVAVSGGTAEQDTSLGEFAKNKFKEILSWRLTKN